MTGQAEIQLRVEGETAWLTQFEMAELFHTSVPNINIHIRNILDSGDLHPEATIKEDLIVRQEGGRQVRRKVKLYNLSMILAVGYRVQSPRGTQFRQWATAHLEEYLVKGFVMDDQRLKEPGDQAAQQFFAEVQNKLLYAVTSHTAAELVVHRADPH